jgi:hypothetical protein
LPPVVTTDTPARRATTQAAQVGEAELGAQRLAEGVARLDDAGLDQHLPHRDVDATHQGLDLFQLRRNVGHEQLVGPLIGDDAAAR